MGSRPRLEGKGLEQSQFPRGEVGQREEARAAAVSEERYRALLTQALEAAVIFVSPGGEARPDATAGDL